MGERALTAGEISLAQRIYKTAINYGKVKIHDEKYMVFQPDHSGMTPNGEIYVSGTGTYTADYSTSPSADLRSFFIHEMAHVWQYQLNILSPIGSAIAESFRHFFNYAKAYEYELVTGKDLLDYRIEQQAQIIQDYYLWFLEASQPRQTLYLNKGPSSTFLPLYHQVLARFMANPGYAKHTIVCTRDTAGPPSARHTTCTRRLAP